MAIEQVRYTWATKGLHGMGMYQPVAASAGILNEDQSIQQLVYRLCRLDRSSSTQVVPSYGWIDAANRRFAFCRTFLNDLQVGRPGNFAAHVLIADPSDLPADRLLALFDSNFWWTEPEEDEIAGELPALSVLPDPGRGMNPSPDEEHLAEEILQRILDGERSIQVVAPPRSLVASLTSIASVLPRLIDQRSFSTWESADPRGWFDIVGVELGANPEAPPQPSEVPSFLLSTRKYNAQFDQALGRDTVDPDALSSFKKIAHLLRQLEFSEPPDQGEFLLGIALNSTVSVVLEFASAQDLAARLVVEGSRVARQALQANAGPLSTQVLAELGRLVAVHLPSDSVSDELGLWADRMPPALMEGFLHGLLKGQGLQSDSSIPERWPKQVLLAALRLGSSGPNLNAIVASAAVKGELAWVFDHAIAERIRADLLQAMLLGGRSRLSAEDVAAALNLVTRIMTRAPGLVVGVFAGLPVTDRVDLLLQVLEDLPISNDPPPEDLLNLVSGLLAEIPSSTAGELLLRIDKRFGKSATVKWDQLADEVLRRLVETIIDDPYRRYPPQLFRLRDTLSSSGSLWGDLIGLAFGPLNDLSVPPREGQFDQLQRRFLIDAATATYPANPARLAAIMRYTRTSAESGTSDFRYLLLAGIRASSAYDHPETTALILRHVGQSLLSEHSARLGKLPSKAELSGLAADAFEALASNDKELAQVVLEFFEELGKSAKPWTTALQKSANRGGKQGSRRSRV